MRLQYSPILWRRVHIVLNVQCDAGVCNKTMAVAAVKNTRIIVHAIEIYDSLYMERPYCLVYPCFGIFLTSNAIQESATIIAVAVKNTRIIEYSSIVWCIPAFLTCNAIQESAWQGDEARPSLPNFAQIFRANIRFTTSNMSFEYFNF